MKKILLKHVVYVTRFLCCTFMVLGVGLPFASHGKVPDIKAEMEAILNKAAEVTVTGTVTDIDGQAIPGVTVSVPRTTIGTATDLDGKYSINVPEGSTLVFSFIGYVSQSIPVGAQSVIDVVLREDISSLEEIVVVGYGEQKKVNLSGAVDNITSKDLAALQVNTIGEALQGQLPGVYVSVADGKPGRSAGFNIRGNTSINGGSPLIVIDGVPQSGSDLNNISPHDIEEISILKDAASTAIYGARASFGVILVTTKRGSKDMSVRYENYFGFSTPTRVPELYENSLDYLSINENEFNGNIGQNYYTDAQVAYPGQVAADPSLPQATVSNIGGRANLLLGGPVYNYYKLWFREFSPKQNHRLSVGGESDRFQYYVSADYNHEKGSLIFKPENINRYTLRSNITYKVNKNLSIFNSTSLIKRDEEHPNQYLYGFTSNVYRFIENSNPMMPEYVEIDGEMVPTDIGFYREFVEKQSGIEEGMHDARTTFGIDLNLLNEKLKIHADGTYQFGFNETLRWWDNTGPYLSNSFNNRNIVLDYYSDAGPAKVYRSNGRTLRNNVNAYATYDASTGRNNILIMAGFNQEKYDYLYSYAERENPLQVPQNSLNLASGAANVRDDDDRNASRSVFTRLNYNWDEKYLLEINGSYFLSSKFAKENRGQAFVAGSAAWRISEEQFFDPIRNVINNLKLRGSYGSIGNANIGSYDYIPIMGVSQSAFTLEGQRVNYTSVPSPKSANFTWETVESINLGLDFSVFRNRLIGTLDIYERNTTNMLANFRSLPSVFGATVPKENIAALKTKGWELNLGWQDELELNSSPFIYGVRVNLSDYTSEITEYYNPTNYLADYYPGQKMGEIWGLNTLGYFLTDDEAENGALLATNAYRPYAAAGTIKFDDVNGDGLIDFGSRTLENPGDYKIIGNTTPRYQYGITLNGSWKGFDFNAFFRGVGKQDIYPGSEAVNFWGPYNRKYQVMLKHTVEERWTPENPDAYFPRPQGYLALGSNDLGVPQTKYLQDASFIRLKNLTVGYTLPASLTQRVKLSNLRVYVSGQNLWEATGLHFSLDPEGLTKDPDANAGNVGLGTAYPIQRVYAFGFQIQL
jgi:TonB-linked SusC/RagA family outer membrane protein